MVDRYRTIRAPDSHGDIIHWPIKALCDYIEASDDLSILDDEVAWTNDETGELATDTSTIFEHTERQVDRIERDCIPGTALPIFAGGDWEDTLQPADPAMARQLVSAMTGEFNASEYKDEYRDALMQVIESKVEGHEVKAPEPAEETGKLVDLMAALEASVNAAKAARSGEKPVSVAEAKKAREGKAAAKPAASRSKSAARDEDEAEAEHAAPKRKRKTA
jgi:hypothetical protein